MSGLRQDRVSYIFAGEQQLDLGLALPSTEVLEGGAVWLRYRLQNH